ncbi:hypothetical protein FRC12_023322 [Ceratobasidium sp. 428]|nr:hypothetical protein FRC12_023322 [Ceratobasidium sp. 428]
METVRKYLIVGVVGPCKAWKPTPELQPAAPPTNLEDPGSGKGIDVDGSNVEEQLKKLKKSKSNVKMKELGKELDDESIEPAPSLSPPCKNTPLHPVSGGFSARDCIPSLPECKRPCTWCEAQANPSKCKAIGTEETVNADESGFKDEDDEEGGVEGEETENE